MGKKIEYFLIARENQTNQVKRIPIHGKYGLSLEEIDEMTTEYPNARKLAESFVEGYQTPPVTDYYIAYQGQDNALHTMEVIYQDSLLTPDFIEDAKNNQMKNSNRRIDIILLGFTNRIATDESYYQKVIRQGTDIYPKFIQYILENRYIKWDELKRKDGGWVQKSYPLMRNILSSLQKLGEKFPIPTDGRKEVEDEVYQMTDPDYDENQYHFSDYDWERKEDPYSEVMYNLDRLKTSDFVTVGSEVFFQPREEITEEEVVQKLQNLLPESLMKYFYCLTLEEEVSQRGEKGKEEEIRDQIQNILETEPKTLEQAYEWTKLYQKYQLGLEVKHEIKPSK